MEHPDNRVWLEVHFRFTQGDQTAWEEIAAYFLPRLSQWLSYRHPNADAHLLGESVEDALIGYQKDPQGFDASRGVPLSYWLLFQARGHLSHKLRREQRYHVKELTSGVDAEDFSKIVENMSRKRQGNGYLFIEGESEIICSEEMRRWLDATFSENEQVEFGLLVERKPLEVWAQLLGVESLPEAEQRRLIDREKERIRKKRLRTKERAGRCPAVIKSFVTWCSG